MGGVPCLPQRWVSPDCPQRPSHLAVAMALFAAPCARFSIIMLWFWALPAVSGTAAASSPQSRPLRLLLGVLRGGCASAGAALDPPRDETARAAVRQLDDELREAVRSLNASRAEALVMPLPPSRSAVL